MGDRTYWAGFLTPFAAALIFAALVFVWARSAEALSERGWSLETKTRDLEGISDYVLRHDIWWERAWGPVFVGGWYREKPKLRPDSLDQYVDQRLVGRWAGLGRADGRCVMVIHTSVLEPSPERTAQPTQPGTTP